MRTAFALTCALAVAGSSAFGQEADSGLDLRATFSAAAFDAGELKEAPRNGSPLDAGFRAVFYPTLKIDEHWSAQLNVENIFNQGYWATADGNNNISPGQGRTLRVMARARF